MEISSVEQQCAAVILGEIDPNVETFKTVGQLAS